MSRPALTLMALASATFALGAPAQAGGGVRLNFGGPLGTFVATPTPGYGVISPTARSKPAPKVYTAKRTPPAPANVAERKSKSEPRVVPVAYSTESKPKTLPVTAASHESPGLLSRALTLDSLPRAEAVRTLPPSELIVAQDAAGGDSPAAPKPQTASKPAPKIAEAGPVTCRKFIPAVSVTVTVPCD